jgi:NAD(P)-dependent dehydrogenase (short-subunit alcohol dehydrogenase family)
MTGCLIITGASQGIGAATARLAAGAGYAVCVNYHGSPDRADALANAISAGGGRACAVKADISDVMQIDELFNTAEEAFGPVAGLVNNASRYSTRDSLAELTAEDIERTIAVTLVGTMLCTRAAISRMATSRGGAGGSVVNLSSNAVNTGGFRLSPYVTAKGGIEAFTKALAQEAGSDGIRVNAVSPGAIATETTAAAGPEWVERQEKATPLGKIGTAEDVAKAILWLLSDDAAHITGAILPITGGRN